MSGAGRGRNIRLSKRPEAVWKGVMSMSMPSFPVVDPPIDREGAVNQILSSIAMEELGLSHILNAEGEKLQYILGTLPGLSGPPATVSDVLAANTASTIAPLVSLSHFSNEIMLNLAAGTTISLQMFGIVSAATLLPGSAGASLMITRLS